MPTSVYLGFTVSSATSKPRQLLSLTSVHIDTHRAEEPHPKGGPRHIPLCWCLLAGCLIIFCTTAMFKTPLYCYLLCQVSHVTFIFLPVPKVTHHKHLLCEQQLVGFFFLHFIFVVIALAVLPFLGEIKKVSRDMSQVMALTCQG